MYRYPYQLLYAVASLEQPLVSTASKTKRDIAIDCHTSGFPARYHLTQNPPTARQMNVDTEIS